MKYISLLIFISLSSTTFAQVQNHANEKLRKGGDTTRFRTISNLTESEFPFSADVKSAVLSLRWEDAWKGLQGVDLPTTNLPARFLYGRIAYENKKYDVALKLFSKDSLKSDSLLGRDSKIWAAKSAFGLKKYHDSAGLLTEVSQKDPFWKKGSFLFTHTLIASNRLEKGIRALKVGIKLGDRSNKTPKHLLDIGKLLAEKGKLNEAVLAWRYALVHFPGHASTKKIRALFEKMKDKFSPQQQSKFSSFSDTEKLTIGRHLFEAHLNKRAIETLETLDSSKDKEIRCEALYLTGRTFTKLRTHKDAIPWYKKAIQSCPDANVFYRKSLYQLGRSQWNASNGPLAISTFKKLEREFEGHSYADDAMLYRGRILKEQGKTEAANLVFKKQLEKYPKGDMAPDAQWYLFHDAFASGRYRAAIELAEKFEKVGDEYSLGRLPYFLARAKQLSKRAKVDTIKAYEKVILDYPLTYYALLASQRLAEISPGNSFDACASHKSGKSTPKRCKLWSVGDFEKIHLSETLRNRKFYQKGKILTTLGLLQDARTAFKTLRQTASKSDLWGLALILDSAGVFSISHDIARRRTGSWENVFPRPQTHRRWKISFPRPYLDEVNRFTKKVNLEREIVYAIMREESGYNPQIRSWAGARGLLQLMPSTAKVTASRSGIDKSKANHLLEPKNAIEIGTAYMNELSDQTLGHPAFIIAGYNGGWGNLSRWLKKTKTNQLDLFIEEIPYGQTRNYTKRVLRSYWAYKIIYAKQTVPSVPMNIGGQIKKAKK